MKIAHLIIAHSKPKQLERLIIRLAHSDAKIYIHLDKKADFQSFAYLHELENVIFIKKRVKVYWGTYSIIKATINGFREILDDGEQYDFVNLLSGEDYPLQTPEYVHQYLSRYPGVAFMDFLHFGHEWTEAESRVKAYFFDSLNLPGKYRLQYIVNKVFPSRRFPKGLTPVGSSQWFTIPKECVRFIENYWKKNWRLRLFTRFTWAPDEFIFQTILYNSEYRSKMVNDNLRYIDWSMGGRSPKILTMSDAEKLSVSGKLYARKFDAELSKDLIDFIDENMLK